MIFLQIPQGLEDKMVWSARMVFCAAVCTLLRLAENEKKGRGRCAQTVVGGPRRCGAISSCFVGVCARAPGPYKRGPHFVQVTPRSTPFCLPFFFL